MYKWTNGNITGLVKIFMCDLLRFNHSSYCKWQYIQLGNSRTYLPDIIKKRERYSIVMSQYFLVSRLRCTCPLYVFTSSTLWPVIHSYINIVRLTTDRRNISGAFMIHFIFCTPLTISSHSHYTGLFCENRYLTLHFADFSQGY